MQSDPSPDARSRGATGTGAGLRRRALRSALIALVLGFVVWAHHFSGREVVRPRVAPAPGWAAFHQAYGIASFGEDGYFTRAAQHGYNLFFHTHEAARRFTRKTANDPVRACASCHAVEDLAYGFVNADRHDARLGRRVSFEERVMRCYAGPMQGYVPTLYDPAVRDIRVLARAVAHHLQLTEGTRRPAR